MEKVKDLKVGDVVPGLRAKDVDDITASLTRMQNLTKEYTDHTDLLDLDFLEDLKRRYIAELTYLNTLYSITKSRKGESFIYFSENRKQIKAEALQILLNEGKKISAAEIFVYSHPYYVDRLALLDKLKIFFLKVEHLQEHFTYTLQAIIQSVSISRGEKSNSIHI